MLIDNPNSVIPCDKDIEIHTAINFQEDISIVVLGMLLR